MARFLISAILMLSLVSCGPAPPAGDTGYGPNPDIGAPPPRRLLPTINTPRAVGWPEAAAPVAPAGFTVTRYAEGLAHPRWLYMLPNGDVLVAESSTEAQRGGAAAWVRNAVQRRAGALAGSANRITLLRDGDGRVDERHAFAENLNQPMGMALIGDRFFIANTDAILSFPYTPGALRVTGRGDLVMPLPNRPGDNGHWTRTLAVSPDGGLFVAVGSATNIGEDGMAVEQGRAAIWRLDPSGANARIFASGLRNPVGLAFEPQTGALWTSVNERDMLGDNLVPDYMTSVRDGAFYGWPYSYFGQHVDQRVRPRRPDMVAEAVAPDYALGSHTASLGLHFYQGEAFPARYRGGAFIGQHGSWNRSVPAGYRVIFVPFSDGRPAGDMEEFLTGFLNAENQAQGRPVGVAEDRAGALLVADDVGDIIWRVAYTGAPSQ